MSEFPLKRPTLACCNFFPEVTRLKPFALEHGFGGVDWSFSRQSLPPDPAGDAELARVIAESEREMEIFKTGHAFYGYVFFVLRRSGDR